MLTKKEIKTDDILVAIDNRDTTELSIKEIYDLLLASKKIKLTIQRPVVLTSLDNRSIKSSSMDEIIKGSAETKLKAVIERQITF